MRLSNSQITFDEGVFVFETVIRIRSTEVKVAQHLTLDSLTVLLAEAQERFLYSKGIKEIIATHQSLLVDHLCLSFTERVQAREELLFEVGVEQVSDDGGDIGIKVTRMCDGSLVAKARQHFIVYDFQLDKKLKLDNTLKEALKPRPFEL